MPFSEKKAARAVKFFEGVLTHTKGGYAKKPFILPPWQKKIIRDLFGTLRRDDLRQYSTAYVEVPKKNGKSEIAAGIALYCLTADGEPGAEVYSAAATRDQASLVFKVAAQMVRNSRMLSKKCKVIDSTKTITLRADPNSFYRAISADAGTQDGVNPSCVVFDELHRQKRSELWDVLRYGMETRRQPLLFAITTAGIHGESPVCWDQHEYARQIIEGIFTDSTFYPVIYSLPDDEDWSYEGHPARGRRKATGWYKANPALGDFLSLEKVREAAKKAKKVVSQQHNFWRFRLNRWVQQVSRWITMREWNACGKTFNDSILLGQPCYAGLDLSTTRDITALVLVFPIGEEFYVKRWSWVPQPLTEQGSGHDDEMAKQYSAWLTQGLIETTDGEVLDMAAPRNKINQLGEIYDIREIAYDRWGASKLRTELEGDGFTMVEHGQGYKDMSPASKDFERLILSRSLRHGDDPVLKWMMDCTTVKQDEAGNIKPVKPDRLKSKKRIDGIVATIMGLRRAVLHDESGEYDGTVTWV